MSGDQEPWVFRGGLQADFQVRMPCCVAEDTVSSRRAGRSRALQGETLAVRRMCTAVTSIVLCLTHLAL